MFSTVFWYVVVGILGLAVIAGRVLDHPLVYFIAVFLLDIILTVAAMRALGPDAGFCLGVLLFICIGGLIGNFHYLAVAVVFLLEISLIVAGVAWLLSNIEVGTLIIGLPVLAIVLIIILAIVVL